MGRRAGQCIRRSVAAERFYSDWVTLTWGRFHGVRRPTKHDETKRFKENDHGELEDWIYYSGTRFLCRSPLMLVMLLQYQSLTYSLEAGIWPVGDSALFLVHSMAAILFTCRVTCLRPSVILTRKSTTLIPNYIITKRFNLSTKSVLRQATMNRYQACISGLFNA